MSTLSPDEYLVISKQYDFKVATYAELLAGIADEAYFEGDRILVEHDENASGFWTLWAYRPNAAGNDENGLVFEGSQTYRTADFIEIVDWYAPGYSPLTPPRIGYPNPAVRDLYEGPSPANPFVRVEDDGTTGWSWTFWDGTGWNVVAREKGTIRFSDKFYDAARTIFADDYNVTEAELSKIPSRDGANELRQIFNTLRFDVLTDAEKNELFFSMLSFYHSQQDQVDWAFKTSFLTVLGYNERLTQTPIATYDNTENLLEYLDEVKPYHVKVRDFSRVLAPDIEAVNVHATDFDKPAVFDAATNSYRRLDPRDPADLDYMSKTAPWKDWYANRTNPNFGSLAANRSPIRSIGMKMTFDRFDRGGRGDDENLPMDSGFGWDLASWDILGFDGTEEDVETGGNALVRLVAYYHPTLGMVAASPDELLSGWTYRGIILDGGDLYVPRGENLTEWGIRPYDTLPVETNIHVEKDVEIDRLMEVTPEVLINPNATDGGMRDPYTAPRHPEELVPVLTNCALTITVAQGWSVGAPNQSVVTLDTARLRRATANLPYGLLASSNDAIHVYRDGVRAVEGDDYTIDTVRKVIKVKLGSPKASRVSARIFGIAGSNGVDQVRELVGDGTQTTFAFEEDRTGRVEAFVNGVRVVPASVANRVVTLSRAPAADASVVLVAYPDATTTAGAVFNQQLVVNSAQRWTINNPTTSGEPVDHIGTILSLNGRTLKPPFTRYGDFREGNRLVPFKELTSVDNLKIWLQGLPFTGIVGHVVDDGLPHTADRIGSGWDIRGWDTDLYDVSGEIVLWRDHLWLNDIGLLVEYDLRPFDEDDFDRPGTLIPSRAPLDLREEYVPANRVMAVAYEGHDYTVDGTTLRLLTPLNPTDFGFLGWDENPVETRQAIPADTRLVATTFSNAEQMDITTHCFEGSIAGAYRVPVTVPSTDYLIVTLDGQMMTPTIDYTISTEVIGFDESTSDHIGFGHSDDYLYTIVTIPGGQEKHQSVVITAFEGPPCGMPELHSMMTSKPSAAMMGDAIYVPDWGFAPFDTIPMASNVPMFKNFGTEEKPDNRNIYRMNDTWQVFTHDEQRRFRLDQDVLDDAREIVVRLPESLENPFEAPDLGRGIPGVLWIGGERIEYFLMEEADGLVVFRQIRRGTRATRTGEERRVRLVRAGNGATVRFVLAGADLATAYGKNPVEVSLLGRDGRRTKQAPNRDYTLVADAAGVAVVFITAPATGTTVCLGQSLGAMHRAGAEVRNISQPMAQSFGPFRIKDVPPEADLDPNARTFLLT